MRQFLGFHVLGSSVRFEGLSEAVTVRTIVGPSPEYIKIYPDPPLIDDRNSSRNASVLVDDGLVDIEAANGVLHGIDSVMHARFWHHNMYELMEFHYRGMGPFFDLVKLSSLEDKLSGEGPFTAFGEQLCL